MRGRFMLVGERPTARCIPMLMLIQTPPPRMTQTKSRSPRTIYLTFLIKVGSGGKQARQTEQWALCHRVRIPGAFSFRYLRQLYSADYLELRDVVSILEEAQYHARALYACG